jgi:hypothetical protein
VPAKRKPSFNQLGFLLAKKVLHTDKRTESMVGMKKKSRLVSTGRAPNFRSYASFTAASNSSQAK